MERFDNTETFEFVMGQLGPQIWCYMGQIIDLDRQIEATDDLTKKAELNQKKQEACEEAANMISDFLMSQPESQ